MAVVVAEAAVAATSEECGGMSRGGFARGGMGPGGRVGAVANWNRAGSRGTAATGMAAIGTVTTTGTATIGMAITGIIIIGNDVVFIGGFGFPWWWGWGPSWGWDYGYPYYGYYPYGYGGAYGYGYGYGVVTRMVMATGIITDTAMVTGNGYGAEYQSRYGNSSQSRVSELQRRLSRAGYYHGSVDGVLGPQTRRAIRAYEQDHDNAG